MTLLASNIQQKYTSELGKLLKESDCIAIKKYLLTNSNLPGPRANLSLADVFAKQFGHSKVNPKLVDLLFTFASFSAIEAPTNDSREFLPLCAIQALGVIYTHLKTKYQDAILTLLKKLANDQRWRIREAVAMALQKISEVNFQIVENIFSAWLKEKMSAAEKRAVLVALAHPPTLKHNETHVKFCLQIADSFLQELVNCSAKKYEGNDFEILLKGLEFTLSVFVAYFPAEGFKLLAKYASSKNKYLNKIIYSNLQKARLKKYYPGEVKAITKLMDKKDANKIN